MWIYVEWDYVTVVICGNMNGYPSRISTTKILINLIEIN
jgi:hypothetical protein